MALTEYFDKSSAFYETETYGKFLYLFYGGLEIGEEDVNPFNQRLQNSIGWFLQNKDGIILDLGCGTGMFSRSLSREAKQVYGIDISLGALKKAQENAANENILNLTFARADVEKLPFKDETFDAVSCIGALQLFQDCERALTEINRVLKKGGRVVVMTYLRRRYMAIRFLRELVEKEGYVHFFEVEELKGLVERTGYHNFEYASYGSLILFRVKK